jgi:murein DD-endopeptidase MepM/ murein hydrolase activator NlpD
MKAQDLWVSLAAVSVKIQPSFQQDQIARMQNIQPLLAYMGRHKRWLLLVALIPLFEVVTAFGVSPDTVTQNIPQETIVSDLALPAPTATDSGSFDFWREERIQSGDTLALLLSRLGVNSDESAGIITASKGHKAVTHFVAGRSIMARVTSSGSLVLLRYLVDNQQLLSIERTGSNFLVKEESIKPETRLSMRSGTVNHSLFGATDAADVPDSIASEMADIFSGDIDFHRDLRQGDHFSVVYETLYDGGRILSTGRLLAAEFVNQGKTYQAIYFKDPQGHEGYFTPEGKNLKHAFLKSPLPFTRITSFFTSARFHPILNIWRAHKGVDYAASIGTPVRAVADATVSFAGQQTGYGNLVILKHQGPYSTAYGHLSRFAKGMHKGSHVAQGQVFAYTGATGWATGPHLHYEFRINNVQVDPLKAKMPTAFPLEARYRKQFAATATPLTAQLDQLSEHNLAALD